MSASMMPAAQVFLQEPRLFTATSAGSRAAWRPPVATSSRLPEGRGCSTGVGRSGATCRRPLRCSSTASATPRFPGAEFGLRCLTLRRNCHFSTPCRLFRCSGKPPFPSKEALWRIDHGAICHFYSTTTQMMSRQCTKHVFLTEGSSSSILHGLGSRGTASRSRTALNFHRFCIRAKLWRTDHLHISTTRSEIKVHTLLQVRDIFNSIKIWSKLQLVTVTGLAACVVLLVPSAGATDALKTCTCLLKECRIELAKCIANPSCAANVACLNTCNNRPDETECQIKCGDLFANSVVDEFNECAVSRKKCVPKKSDVGEFPVPDPSALVKNFNMADFSGKWYISSGLNPTFDTFDCQFHEFHLEGDRLVANLSWRIPTPDTGFFTRGAVQRFVQDPSQPAILYNHDNEYLHYQDDWYILSSKIENKEDDYIFVYYRGRNDAWDGYGGAVIYTRSKELPETIVPELERAVKSVGRDFSTFIRTDNTCGPEPPLADRIEKTVEKGERIIINEVKEIEGEIEGEVKELEEEETLVKRLADGIMEVKQDVMNFLQGLSKEEMDILDQLNMEATEVEELFSRSLPIRKLR